MIVRGLWGLQLDPGKPRTFTSEATFKITMATICEFNGKKRTSAYLTFQGRKFLLCSLIPEKNEQQVIDITCLRGEKITMETDGPNSIHLLGNYISQKSDSEDEETNDLVYEMENKDRHDVVYEVIDDEDDVSVSGRRRNKLDVNDMGSDAYDEGQDYGDMGDDLDIDLKSMKRRIFDESDDFDEPNDNETHEVFDEETINFREDYPEDTFQRIINGSQGPPNEVANSSTAPLLGTQIKQEPHVSKDTPSLNTRKKNPATRRTSNENKDISPENTTNHDEGNLKDTQNAPPEKQNKAPAKKKNNAPAKKTNEKSSNQEASNSTRKSPRNTNNKTNIVKSQENGDEKEELSKDTAAATSPPPPVRERRKSPRNTSKAPIAAPPQENEPDEVESPSQTFIKMEEVPLERVPAMAAPPSFVSTRQASLRSSKNDKPAAPSSDESSSSDESDQSDDIPVTARRNSKQKNPIVSSPDESSSSGESDQSEDTPVNTGPKPKQKKPVSSSSYESSSGDESDQREDIPVNKRQSAKNSKPAVPSWKEKKPSNEAGERVDTPANTRQKSQQKKRVLSSSEGNSSSDESDQNDDSNKREKAKPKKRMLRPSNENALDDETEQNKETDQSEASDARRTSARISTRAAVPSYLQELEDESDDFFRDEEAEGKKGDQNKRHLAYRARAVHNSIASIMRELPKDLEGATESIHEMNDVLRRAIKAVMKSRRDRGMPSRVTKPLPQYTS